MPEWTHWLAFKTVLSAWALWLGIDFFLHGGILAWVYEAPSAFLLPPMQLFLRIPLAYTAFLLFVATLIWLLRTLDVREPRRGAAVGAAFGAAITIANTLTLLSVSTLSISLAAIWTMAQIVEFGATGYASVWVAGQGGSLRSVGFMAAIAMALVVAGVIAQNVLG